MSEVEVTEAWRALLYAHDRLIRIFEADFKDRWGLTKPKFDVLRRLLEAEGHRARTQELAQALFYSSGAATKVIDRLVARGLVARSSHETDRRVVFVTLTPTGLALAREVVDEHRALIRQVVPPFASATEARHVMAFLNRLAAGPSD